MPAHSARRIPVSTSSRMMAVSRRLVQFAPLAGLEQPSEVLGPDHVDGLLGELGRPHAVHRAGLKVALGHGPLEEGVQAPVAVVGGRRLPAGELVGDERLDVLAAEFAGEERLTVGLAVDGEQPGGVGVGLHGPGALVLGFQCASEAAVEGQEMASRQRTAPGCRLCVRHGSSH
jgi:hypothetical protein